MEQDDCLFYGIVDDLDFALIAVEKKLIELAMEREKSKLNHFIQLRIHEINKMRLKNESRPTQNMKYWVKYEEDRLLILNRELQTIQSLEHKFLVSRPCPFHAHECHFFVLPTIEMVYLQDLLRMKLQEQEKKKKSLKHEILKAEQLETANEIFGVTDKPQKEKIINLLRRYERKERKIAIIIGLLNEIIEELKRTRLKKDNETK